MSGAAGLALIFSLRSAHEFDTPENGMEVLERVEIERKERIKLAVKTICQIVEPRLRSSNQMPK